MQKGPGLERGIPQLHVGAPSQMGRRVSAAQGFCLRQNL